MVARGGSNREPRAGDGHGLPLHQTLVYFAVENNYTLSLQYGPTPKSRCMVDLSLFNPELKFVTSITPSYEFQI